MLHINKKPRYTRIWEDLKTVYACRGTSSAHYIAGMTIGSEITKGVTDTETRNLSRIFNEARNAQR